jgi:hypothetical protein
MSETNGKQKSVMFVTGPVEFVEDQINNLDGTWASVDHWHHLVDDKACVTVRLIPMAAIRQAQILGAMPAISRGRG